MLAKLEFIFDLVYVFFDLTSWMSNIIAQTLCPIK